MDSWPKITVITVVRNSAATLAKAMESLRAQDYPNLEYLVLDGGSTDGTLDIIRANQDLISFWKTGPDGGPNDAYNTGIARATGQIIGLLNADDWYEPGALRAVGEAYRADPSLDVVTCEACVWRQGEDGALKEIRRFTGKNLELSPRGSPMPNARFWRKSVFERFGGFLTKDFAGRRLIASDLEFLLRVSDKHLSHRALPITGYHYRMHAGSITFGENPERLRQMYEERAWIAETYLKNPYISENYASRLRRWHRRGTVRAFFWNLAARDFKKAVAEARRGLKVSRFRWLPDAARLAITRGYDSL